MRLNTGILNQIREQIKIDIKEYLKENDTEEVSPPIVWDASKAVLRGKIIGYCSTLKKQRKEKLERLQTELKKLEKIHKNTLNKGTKQEIERKKNELNEIYSNDIKKKLVFLKQRHYEVGGKSAKLLAYKLKKQQAENTIYQIKDPITNSIHSKAKDIKKSFEVFFKNLYAQPETDESKMETFFDLIELPQVKDEQNKFLISDITDEEIKQAIRHLKTNKAPGPDGFPSEWYKEMNDLLIPMLKKTYNYVIKTGITPPSWKEAVISLIPKDGKNKLECGSYRPISVLNQDYKIFTHILAKRIENILPEIISLDQTGFIKQRQTQDNIRRTLHIIDHIAKNKTQAVLLSLDAEKAFDRVNWKFLYKVLQKFGFHQTVIKTIQALYNNPKAMIKINGDISNSFDLKRGTRQGCPISPLLFAIFIEALRQGIVQDREIRGIKMFNQEHKISLFADDVLIYLTNPESSILKLLSFLDAFGAVSGYKLNIKKTQVLSFEYEPSQTVRSNIEVQWDQEYIKYLGVNIPKDIKNLYALNFNQLSQKLKEDLKRWNLIPILSFESRIDSVKMNILPRILYLFQTLPIEITEKQFNEWDKLLSRYIWHGRKPRIKFQTLQLTKGRGGLALPCLKDYYKAAQLRILYLWCNSDYQARWKEIEESVSGAVPIQARLGDKALIKKLLLMGNRWINLSMKVWLNVITKNNLSEEIKVLRWCSYDTDFAPNKMDVRYKGWAQQGLTSYCTFFDQHTLNEFQTLKTVNGLKNSDFYRFLQIRHHINQFMTRSRAAFENSLLKIFISAYRNDSGLKMISRLYKGIQDTNTANSTHIKQKWEMESTKCISEEMWVKYCEFQWKISSSTSWRAFCWKSICRYFITPVQSSHYSGTSNCWRQCGSHEANHYHVFWDCPKVSSFWHKVHTELEIIFETKIIFNWDELFFGLLTSVNTNISNKKLFGILSAAARKAITKKWLKPHTPTIKEWYDIIYEIFVMERITFSLRLQNRKFEEIWKRWKKYSSLKCQTFV